MTAYSFFLSLSRVGMMNRIGQCFRQNINIFGLFNWSQVVGATGVCLYVQKTQDRVVRVHNLLNTCILS